MGVSNETQIQQSIAMIDNIKSVLNSLLTIEMPHIEKRLVHAGQALQILEMRDRLDDHQDGLNQTKKEISIELVEVKRTPESDKDTNSLNGLKNLQQEFERKSTAIDELQHFLSLKTQELKKSIADNAIEEARDTADHIQVKDPAGSSVQPPINHFNGTGPR